MHVFKDCLHYRYGKDRRLSLKEQDLKFEGRKE